MPIHHVQVLEGLFLHGYSDANMVDLGLGPGNCDEIGIACHLSEAVMRPAAAGEGIRYDEVYGTFQVTEAAEKPAPLEANNSTCLRLLGRTKDSNNTVHRHDHTHMLSIPAAHQLARALDQCVEECLQSQEPSFIQVSATKTRFVNEGAHNEAGSI